MRIALCDDDAAELDQMESCLRSCGEARGVGLELDRFATGEDLLAAWEGYDAVFLDIYLSGGVTGLEAAGALSPQLRGRTVLVTSSADHAVEAFGLGCAHYLVKPYRREDIAEALERCLARLEKAPERVLTVKTRRESVHIPMDQIVYIEVFNKLSVIHTARRAVETYASLDALFAQLDGQRFLRVQRSYIVNMGYIESFLFDRVVLKGGTQITLSRTNRAALKQRYQRFLFDLARGDEA